MDNHFEFYLRLHLSVFLKNNFDSNNFEGNLNVQIENTVNKKSVISINNQFGTNILCMPCSKCQKIIFS